MILDLIYLLLILSLLIVPTLKFDPDFLIPSIIIGLVLGVIPFLFKKRLKFYHGQRILFSILGIIAGYLVAYIVLTVISPLLKDFDFVLLPYLKLSLTIFIIYIIALGFYCKSYDLKLLFSDQDTANIKKEKSSDTYKIMDTSVIIDGRISDISETGFLEGILIIPRFVLIELQQIADSSDSLKRQRGRRGLDILNKMKKGIKLIVQIVDDDFPEVKEVDEKLVLLAKKFNGIVVTNDFNLNKVAQIQGVKVLNINELANAVKPIVLPGEELTITVIKEGKDSNQGVGYLEDGTMVVVESGHQYIGKKVDVIVTSVLQTTAGRMIFAK